jgi:hypothetical protein
MEVDDLPSSSSSVEQPKKTRETYSLEFKIESSSRISGRESSYQNGHLINMDETSI